MGLRWLIHQLYFTYQRGRVTPPSSHSKRAAELGRVGVNQTKASLLERCIGEFTSDISRFHLGFVSYGCEIPEVFNTFLPDEQRKDSTLHMSKL